MLLAWLGVIVGVYLPLWVRLGSAASLRRRLVHIYAESEEQPEKRREEMNGAFEASPFVVEWWEFVRRWSEAREAAPWLDRRGPDEPRSPVRLRDVLTDRPLLPRGVRTGLMRSVPAWLGLAGAAGAALRAGLELGAGQAPSAAALPPLAWGLAAWLGCSLANRITEGRYEAEEEWLDRLTETAYRAISHAELSVRAAHAQHAGHDRIETQFTRASQRLEEVLATGLERIERASAQAANLVSEEQKGSLRNVVEELRTSVRRAVDRHLGSLQESLQRAVEHQDSVAGSLAQNLERMAESAETHGRVTETLESAAAAVQSAADSMCATAHDMQPVLDGLRDTGSDLRTTAGHIDRTQQSATRAAEEVRGSLEQASGSLREQKELIERGLSELRTVVELLSSGLGDQLAAALERVDDSLSEAVDQLRGTIGECNDTVDRLSLPIRASESVNRDVQAMLERMRRDIHHLSRWLIESVEPVRTVLDQIDDRSGQVARSLHDFGQRADSLEKTLDALRGSIDGARRGGALPLAGAAEAALGAGAEGRPSERPDAAPTAPEPLPRERIEVLAARTLGDEQPAPPETPPGLPRPAPETERELPPPATPTDYDAPRASGAIASLLGRAAPEPPADPDRPTREAGETERDDPDAVGDAEETSAGKRSSAGKRKATPEVATDGPGAYRFVRRSPPQD